MEPEDNLKCMPTWYEQLFGIRINYSKSELIPLGLDDQETAAFTQAFCLSVGTFPIKYLGIPLYYEKLNRADLQPLNYKIL
jgi:hypothetical protein